MDHVREDDIPFLLEMFEENFGGGYLSEEEIRHYIQDENEFFYAVRTREGRIAGILLYGVESAETLHAQTKIPLEELKRMARGKKLLKCRSMCMASDCQGQGIGKALFAGALADLRARGEFGAITSLLWTYDGKSPARSLHVKNGFRYIHTLSRPWYHLKDYYCVYCKGRCRCDGDQYVLEFDEP